MHPKLRPHSARGVLGESAAEGGWGADWVLCQGEVLTEAKWAGRNEDVGSCPYCCFLENLVNRKRQDSGILTPPHLELYNKAPAALLIYIPSQCQNTSQLPICLSRVPALHRWI